MFRVRTPFLRVGLGTGYSLVGWARVQYHFKVWVRVEICGVGSGLSSCGLGRVWVQLSNPCRAPPCTYFSNILEIFDNSEIRRYISNCSLFIALYIWITFTSFIASRKCVVEETCSQVLTVEHFMYHTSVWGETYLLHHHLCSLTEIKLLCLLFHSSHSDIEKIECLFGAPLI